DLGRRFQSMEDLRHALLTFVNRPTLKLPSPPPDPVRGDDLAEPVPPHFRRDSLAGPDRAIWIDADDVQDAPPSSATDAPAPPLPELSDPPEGRPGPSSDDRGSRTATEADYRLLRAVGPGASPGDRGSHPLAEEGWLTGPPAPPAGSL